MPAKPPFYKQETDYSCAPACLRMVLASLDVIKTEKELRELCDCTVLGTEAFQVVKAARSLGLIRTRKYNLRFDELESELQRGLYPIVYIRARLSPDQPFQEHAVVVVEITGNEVKVLDPAHGEQTVSRDEFSRIWDAMNRLTILVE